MAEDGKEEAPSSQELLEYIKAEVARGSLQPERFTRLLYVIAQIEDQGSTTVTCQTCRENLDLIAVDELAGLDIFQQYPNLILHLISCQDCRAAYLLLRETLRSEQEGNMPLMIASPNPLLEPTQAPWRRVEGPSPGSLPLRFEVARDFITRALRGPKLASVRGEKIGEEDQSILLLADLLQTKEGTYVAEATMHRYVGRPKSVDLEVRLTGDDPIPSGLTIHILWSDLRRSAPIVEGRATWFESLPLTELVDSQTGNIKSDLKLTFNRD